MKIISKMFLIFFILCCCSKNTSDTEKKLKILKYVSSFSNTENKRIQRFSFSNENRLDSVIYTDSASSSFEVYKYYSDGRIKSIYFYSDGRVYYSKDYSYINDTVEAKYGNYYDNNPATYAKEKYVFRNDTSIYILCYNCGNNNYIDSLAFCTKFKLTWSEGNIIKQEESENLTPIEGDTIYYEYDNKENPFYKIIYPSIYIDFGEHLPTKNNLVKITNKNFHSITINTINYSYNKYGLPITSTEKKDHWIQTNEYYYK